MIIIIRKYTFISCGKENEKLQHIFSVHSHQHPTASAAEALLEK